MKNLDRVDSYRGGCHVGNVPKDKVVEMRQKLKEVAINKQEPRWTPQVWVLDAIKLLKDENWAYAGLSEVFTRRELQKDMLRWDTVEDTVYERVLQELETGHSVAPTPVALSVEEGKSPSAIIPPKAKS
ncbi:hypothetical protein NP233_g8890 [Leucocoprinus birnbaumii]|uniref:Uncharacterized protein n=1 Tax=Leucocoprinus birnbaumii TaxID=56174 RepID=A0AAD5YMQ6_9AGAR|nr:hypothetical protein NP233_g8890 [Leucocoprinus birnbaumii]